MPEREIKKLYYSIGEVCALTDLDAHVLRYWETEFAELKPKKNRTGRRIYTEADLEVVRQIHRLLRDEKYTIEGARQVMARKRVAATEVPTMDRQELEELRNFLVALFEAIPGTDAVDDKTIQDK